MQQRQTKVSISNQPKHTCYHQNLLLQAYVSLPQGEQDVLRSYLQIPHAMQSSLLAVRDLTLLSAQTICAAVPKTDMLTV